MPSSVAEIFAAARAVPAGVVPWGTPPARPTESEAPTTGLYVVSLTDRPESAAGALGDAPISAAAIDALLAVRPELTLDRARPTREQLAERLAAFWLPDEVIVYIGLAGPRASRPPEGEVAKRVGEYYKTPLGARSPHAGGWPLKTLSCLNQLFVHFAYCGDVNTAEHDAIAKFAAKVSAATRAGLHDPLRLMPFANLEFPRGNPKDHGIRGARAPKAAGGSKLTAAATSADAASAPPAPHAQAAPRHATESERRPAVRTVTPHHRSQNVTAKDIEVGQVRIPIGATKRILPPARTDVRVVLRGRDLGVCRWDPRYGTDKERSGVIRVGKAAARELLTGRDVLAVSVGRDGVVTID